MSDHACCAHRHIVYEQVSHDGGTKSDSWLCRDCRTLFWPAYVKAEAAAERRGRQAGWEAGQLEMRERAVALAKETAVDQDSRWQLVQEIARLQPTGDGGEPGEKPAEPTSEPAPCGRPGCGHDKLPDHHLGHCYVPDCECEAFVPTSEEGAMIFDPDSPEYGAFIAAKKAEMDAAYERMHEVVAEAYWGPVDPNWVPPKLTRRQRVAVWWSRVRYRIARPLVRIADWISPGVSGEGCDC